MAAESIQTAAERATKFLKEHPEEAFSKDKPAMALIEDGLRCRVEGPKNWTLVSDTSPTLGGGGSAPSPGWLLRAAEASCVATMIAIRAAQEGITLDKLEVTVDSESDDRGFWGLDDSIPAGPLTSRTRIRIVAPDVPRQRLEEIAAWGQAHSPVSDAVRRAVPKTLIMEFE